MAEYQAVLSKIAEQLGRIADATYMLARATAGEFDEGSDSDTPQYDLSGRPLV